MGPVSYSSYPKRHIVAAALSRAAVIRNHHQQEVRIQKLPHHTHALLDALVDEPDHPCDWETMHDLYLPTFLMRA